MKWSRMPYGRKGTKNKAQHAIEGMSHETDEEAKREYEYEADEAEEEEGIEEAQQARQARRESQLDIRQRHHPRHHRYG